MVTADALGPPHLTWNVVADARELLRFPFMQNAYLAGTIVAVTAGVVGYFMVLRGQTFAGHALSQVGFPGAAGIFENADSVAGGALVVLGAEVRVGLDHQQPALRVHRRPDRRDDVGLGGEERNLRRPVGRPWHFNLRRDGRALTVDSQPLHQKLICFSASLTASWSIG